MVGPFIQTLAMSAIEFDVFAGGAVGFAGLDNYRRALTEPRFWNGVVNTTLFTVITVALQLVLGLGLALILHRKFRGRWIVRVAVLLPWALPTIINSLLFRWMFDAQFGVFNDILLRLGLIEVPVKWLVTQTGGLFVIYATQTWKMSSYMGLILLAGLQGMPDELYEAATVDGASGIAKFTRITLPLLRPSILVAIIFRSVIALQVFDVVYAITQGGPGNKTETLVYYTWLETFRYSEFGYGSAMSVILAIIILSVGVFYTRMLYKRESVTGQGA